jgi:hypothetical protein
MVTVWAAEPAVLAEGDKLATVGTGLLLFELLLLDPPEPLPQPLSSAAMPIPATPAVRDFQTCVNMRPPSRCAVLGLSYRSNGLGIPLREPGKWSKERRGSPFDSLLNSAFSSARGIRFG